MWVGQPQWEGQGLYLPADRESDTGWQTHLMFMYSGPAILFLLCLHWPFSLMGRGRCEELWFLTHPKDGASQWQDQHSKSLTEVLGLTCPLDHTRRQEGRGKALAGAWRRGCQMSVWDGPALCLAQAGIIFEKPGCSISWAEGEQWHKRKLTESPSPHKGEHFSITLIL